MASGIGSLDINNLAQDLALVGSGNPTPTPTNTPVPSPTVTLTPSPSPTNTPSPTPTPATPILQNGGFESGQAPWQETSSGGYQIIQNLNAHSGANSAYLCGYPGCVDRISQTFSVPANYTKLTVTYWWYSDTNKNTGKCLDKFNSGLQTPSGQFIANLQSSCNTNVTNNWVVETFDVSRSLVSFKGKQVMLFFQGTNVNNQYQPTDFFVDDATIAAG
jgi:hypothetical protein